MRQIAAHYIYDGKGEMIKNGLLTLDAEGRVISLSSLGTPIKEIASTEFYNGIILPGMINAHCHLELSHVNLAIEGDGMAAFCKAIMTYKSHLTPNEIKLITQQADAKLYAEGVMAVGDICNTDRTFALKKESKIAYHSFVECLGLDADWQTRYQQFETVLHNAQALGLAASITPHAPYSVSLPLFKACIQTINRSAPNNMISIHNQESVAEQEMFIGKTGSLMELFGQHNLENIMQYQQAYERILEDIAPDIRLLMIHNTFTTMRDYEQIMCKHPQTYWVLCPNSNLFIENQLPPLQMLRDQNATICIGTDSMASNHQLSMLSELKTISQHFPNITLSEMLKWVCINGAEALGMEAELGSFDVGKKAGVCLLEQVNLSELTLKPQTTLRKL